MSRNFELLTQTESELGLPASRVQLAPSGSAIQGIDATHAGSAEMVRLVRSVFLSTNVPVPRRVVFCGVDGENGSSEVCAKAGRVLAGTTSQPVCLIDANILSPRLSGIFGIDTKIPFVGTSALVRDQCVEIGGNLWLAGSRFLTDSRGALLSGDKLKHRFALLLGAFDYVLVDAPGTNESVDAAVLGQVADAAILVIEANVTRRMSARKAKEALERAGVQMLGTVLHNRTFAIPKGIYNKL